MIKKTFLFFLTLVIFGCKSEVDEAYELKQLGLKEQALTILNETLVEDPKNSEGYFARGNIYAEINEIDKAILEFQNALKLEPDNNNYLKTYNYFRYKVVPLKKNSKENHIFLEQLRKNTSNNYLDILIKSSLYFQDSILNVRPHRFDTLCFKKYFNLIKKLTDIKPLYDWQTLSKDSTGNNYEAKYFFVIKDSVEYFDSLNSLIGFYKKEFTSIKKYSNDTVYFTNSDDYALEKRNAYKINKIINNDGDEVNFVSRKYDLYSQTGIIYTNSKYERFINRFRTMWKGKDYGFKKNADEVPDILVEPGSIVYRQGQGIHGAGWYPSFGVHKIRFYFDNVSYDHKIYLTRNITDFSNIIFTSNSKATYMWQMNHLIEIDKEVLKNILSAGYVAKNMPYDLVKLSINLVNEPKVLEFNKDNFREIYEYGDKELIFTNGLLSEIITKDSN